MGSGGEGKTGEFRQGRWIIISQRKGPYRVPVIRKEKSGLKGSAKENRGAKRPLGEARKFRSAQWANGKGLERIYRGRKRGKPPFN